METLSGLKLMLIIFILFTALTLVFLVVEDKKIKENGEEQQALILDKEIVEEENTTITYNVALNMPMPETVEESKYILHLFVLGEFYTLEVNGYDYEQLDVDSYIDVLLYNNQVYLQ